MQQSIQLPNSFAQFILSSLLDELVIMHNEVNGVIENIDIEYVHRIRISIRRYRNNLKLFRYFANQSFYDFLSSKFIETGELSSLLAFARDLDIQHYLVSQFTEETQHAANSKILQTINRERASIQDQLLAYFNGSAYTLLINHGRELESIFSNDAPSFQDDKIIFRSICSALSYALSILYPITKETDGEEIHRFRKAIRRVRYTLETFQPIIAYSIDDVVEESHTIQDLLGDMHDLDMLHHALLNMPQTDISLNQTLLEFTNNKYQLLQLQFVEKIESNEMVDFITQQLDFFSKEQYTIWK
jgi:CHAD domain-containing protein